jgi:hypothetical protein
MDRAYRDIMIAADVAELHGNGRTLGAAYEDVNRRRGTPSEKRIEAIYLALRQDLRVRAELEWRQSGKRIQGVYLVLCEDPADGTELERLFRGNTEHE